MADRDGLGNASPYTMPALHNDDENVAFLHLIVRFDPDLGDRAGLRCFDGDLHLHGLENDENVSLRHGLADFSRNLPYVCGHFCTNISHGAEGTRTTVGGPIPALRRALAGVAAGEVR